jgi:hypothetical protein
MGSRPEANNVERWLLFLLRIFGDLARTQCGVL